MKNEDLRAGLKMFDLTGRKAIVTGAGRGLGKGMAEGLLECGADVVIIGRSHNINTAAQEINKKHFKAGTAAGARAGTSLNEISGDRPGTAYPLMTDLGLPAEREKAFYEAVGMLGGKLDILINNAGIQRRNNAEEFLKSDWSDVIEVNLTAVFDFCRMAGKLMLEAGKGKIINIASMMSFFGGYRVSAYAASKGGIAQLTRALSNEWISKGINVNAIAPGYMATDMNTALINDPDRNTKILARIPAGRWGMPEDMKGLAVFLSSAASDYISGAIIPVDGGYLGA